MKKTLREKMIDLYFKINPISFKSGTKKLLTSTDGIGDNIVRQKILNEFLEKFGEDNIIVMCKDKTVPFLKKIGLKNIYVYTDAHRKTTKGKISLIKDIANLGINEIISLEFDQHDIYIKYLKDVGKITVENKHHPKMNEYYHEVFKRDDIYVMKDILRFYNEYFFKKLTLQDIRPTLNDIYSKDEKYYDFLSVGVGSMDRKKMLSPEKFKDILLEIAKSNLFKGIVLLGKGELEKKFIDELKKELDFKEYGILDLTNSLSLDETIQIINSSKMYLGVDSGLYNFAFGLNKKIVGVFTSNTQFNHSQYDGIEIVIPEKIDSLKEEYFGNGKINSVDPLEVIKKVEELL
ncbi:MAG: glycosyltransferase family 9 protein [Cetobacterium sp.]